MKTYEQLKKEFDKKVKQLQAKCKHEKLSEWMDECWAPGHYLGTQVRVCEICSKVIKTRRRKK